LLKRTRGGSYPSTGGTAGTVRVESLGFVDLDKDDNVVAIEVLGE
jgi:hypothetical protein